MDYNQLIKFFLSTSIITGAIIYLAKLIIDKLAESKLEKYKNSLEKDTESFKQDLSLEAEKFRHRLNITSIEHQIKYTKLYEERGQVIKSIYNLLLELESALANMTTLFQGPEWTTDTERGKKATDSTMILKNYLEQNRIFFSEALCKKIESILEDSHTINVEMYMAKKGALKIQQSNKKVIDFSQEELLKPSDTWHELDEKVQNNIKLARLDLAQEFRILIGVT